MSGPTLAEPHAATPGWRGGAPRWGLCLLPVGILSAALFVLPVGAFVARSIQESPDATGLTLRHYRDVLGDSFYWHAFLATGELAVAVVAGTLVLGFPLAYFLARSRSSWRSTLTALVVVSLFVSIVVRAIGWKVILALNGPVNGALRWAHVIDEPLSLTENFIGTVIGLTHALLPFMVLTLVPVIQLVPRSLEEAAASLGTSRARIIWRVVLPLTLPGIVSGSLMVASMAMGAFTTPALLSGGRLPFVPLLIEQQVLLLLNYPRGAVLAGLLVLVAVVINAVVFRVLRGRLYQASL